MMPPLPDSLTLPPETRLGRGVSRLLLELCASYGRKGVIVCGNSMVRTGELERILDGHGAHVEVRIWLHPGTEPNLSQLEELLTLVREHDPDWVAAVGGGSVLDIAKAAAGLNRAPLPAAAYHDGESIPPSRTVFVAVPTTAGTGSEATTVSVLTNADTGVKKSIRHPSFMANLVLLDPDLLAHCPPEVLAASGMDAFTQAVESFCSRGATWLTDALCLKALQLVPFSLESAFDGSTEFLPELLTGSFLAGIALSNARLGLVHGLAHPLGARFHVPHGLVCAVCLPHVLAFNRDFIPDKYAQMASVLKDDPLTFVTGLLGRLRLTSPFAGKTLHDPDAVIEETLASGSTKANPRPVGAEDVRQMLTDIFA